jgi:UDP-2-acetamido-3-amino-2,3-dideoxy-glucuronate N-acetyltransferase
MSRHGERLVDRDAEGYLVCPRSGWRYQEGAGVLRCVDRDEDAPL